MNERELYQKCLDLWGIHAQFDMVIEECSELIKAICKSHRIGLIEVQENIVEELVDVEIMIEQLKLILGEYLHSYGNMYKNIREQKLDRLRELTRSHAPRHGR